MHTILYVNPSGDVSGAENSLLALIGALDRTEFRPVVACPSPGRFSETCASLNLPVYPIAFHSPGRSTPYSMLILRPLQTCRLRSEIETIVRRENVDLIHANSYLVGPACGMAARRLSLPVIWHIRDMRYGIKQMLIRRLAGRLADRVLVVSQAVKDTFGGRLDEKVQVVYNGIRQMAFSDEIRASCRAELGIAPDELLVGNSGMLVPWKGQDLFVRIAHRVLARVPKARFVIIGSPWPQSLGFDRQVRMLVEKLGLQDKIIFTGYRQDALSITASIDVYLHTARWPDPLPRAVLEAMAAGVPVVAPANGGIPEMIVDGESGLLYRTADVNEAASHVIKLLKCRDLSRKIGEAAKERIRCCFSLEKCGQAIWHVYAELLPEEVRDKAARLHELG